MGQVQLPSQTELVAMLAGLTGKPVTAKPGAPMPAGGQAYVGVYEDRQAAVECLWVCDLPLAASLGALLTQGNRI